MKVLMYGNRKEPCSYWDISTPEKEIAGVKCLFKHLDENWQLFVDNCLDFDKEIKQLQELEISLASGMVPAFFVKETKRQLERLPMLFSEKKKYESEKELVKKSRAGDVKAMKKLLLAIKGEEYADWDVINVMDPLEQ